MTRPIDADVKEMTPVELRHEVMKLRSKVRWHRDLDENQRCWHCDLGLYSVLPEGVPTGRMQGPFEVLLYNCVGYLCQQQCVEFECDGTLGARRRLGKIVRVITGTVVAVARLLRAA